LETWDPKPNAPRETRGEFGTIATAVPGTFLGEHMPRLAQLADRYTILRTMSHEDLDHGSAFYLSMTGHYHNRRSSNPPPNPTTDQPSYGSVLERLRPTQQFPQTSIHLNAPAITPTIAAPGQFGGILGRDYDPMVVGNVVAEPVVIPGLMPQETLPQNRLDTRESLLGLLEDAYNPLGRSPQMGDMNTFYAQAFEMLSTPVTRRAFDLSNEPDKIRDRYGRDRSGQALLLARRLVEAGVPLITVYQTNCNRGQDKTPNETDAYGWDTHNDIFYALREHLLPRFDTGLSALIEDLDDRELLDQTLVVCMGEFGRAPRVAFEANFKGGSPGRKHWAACYSIMLAGAGVKRGEVVGTSDQSAAYPRSEKYGPWDITATIFSALGLDPSGHFTDALGRPFPISTGHP
ncbi:MAG: DUF1501 domain-containing protein, partial [Planctomycetaceae bacterium]|nr:DUF1501 domain-containing protein [Planctomycetaceae bacterium]